jgi:hypothetical protein
LAGAENTEDGHVTCGRVVARIRHHFVGDAMALDMTLAHARMLAFWPAAGMMTEILNGGAQCSEV